MFYENYVTYCKKVGKSKTEVARLIGKSSKSVTGWKNGAVPRNDTLKKLADYFGITIEELVGEKKEPAPNGRFEELSKIFYSLPQNEQEKIADQMTKIIEKAKGNQK